jgi:peptidoglycan/xylan/chitin deacetylase (PgdA/CDA1 family)
MGEGLLQSMRDVLNRIGIGLAHAGGLHRLLGRYTAGRGAILRMHRVRPDTGHDFAPNAAFEIAPSFLAAIVTRLREHGIDIVDLDEAMRRLADPAGRRFAVLTFDDGYRGTVEHAYPVLKREGCPFTVFVTTGFADRTSTVWWLTLEEIVARQVSVAIAREGPTEILPCRTTRQKSAAFAALKEWFMAMGEEVQREAMRELSWRYGVDAAAIADADMMDWDDIRRLAADPLVTIGAHSVTHPRLSALPAQRARAEIRDSARVIEAALGVRPRHFAYPYGAAGDAGAREFAAVAELGFSTGVTSRSNVLVADDASRPTALPRVPIDGRYQSIRYLDLMLSGAVFALRHRFLGPGEPVRASAST